MKPVLVFAISVLLFSEPAPARQASGASDLTALTNKMTAAVLEGKSKHEQPADLCRRLNALYKRSSARQNDPDPPFQLARSALFRFRDEWDCLTNESGPPPRELWDQFKAAKLGREKARSSEEEAQYQDALSSAAVLLLNSVKVTDPRFGELLSSISVFILSKDAAAALTQIALGLPKGAIPPDHGKKIAEAMAMIVGRLPPGAKLEPGQLNAILGFATGLAKANPAWLETQSAGKLLDVVLGALDRVPPQQLDENGKRALIRFLAQLLAQDPKWLQGAQGAALVGFVPRLFEHVDLAEMKPEDLNAMLDFTATITAGNERWPKLMQQLVQYWEQIRQIVALTADQKTRATVLEAIRKVCEMEGGCTELAQEVAKDKPNPGAVASLLRLLGSANKQGIRKLRAILENVEIPQAQIARLGILVAQQLPADCEGVRAAVPACRSAVAFSNDFRRGILGGGPERGNVAPQAIAGPLPTMLTDARCTLMTEEERGVANCIARQVSVNFASFVGLEIVETTGADQGTPMLEARAGCVVVSPTRAWDMPDYFRRAVAVVATADTPEAVTADTDAQNVVAAEDLATRVLDRCSLSGPASYLASHRPSVTPGPQRASSAILFAGLPYLRDGRTRDQGGPPRSLAWGLSAVDASTLLLGTGSLAGAVYAHNSDAGPGGDWLLRSGIVLVGANLLVKAGSALYYHYCHGYGR